MNPLNVTRDEVLVRARDVALEGSLAVPAHASGIVQMVRAASRGSIVWKTSDSSR